MHFYGIAARLNNGEFIVAGKAAYGPIIGANTLDKAKKAFKPYYDLLKLDRDSIAYITGIAQLLVIRPAIYSFDLSNLQTIMNHWRKGLTTYRSSNPIVSAPHVVAPMRKGFLEKFMVLDIVHDIENMITTDKDGALVLQEFKVHYTANGGKPPAIELLTEEKAKEILKKRGLS